MQVHPRTSRKILIASMGVASMTYAIACGGTSTSGDGGPDGTASDTGHPDRHTTDTIDEIPVANLVAHPPDASSDTPTVDEFPVANLVAHPG
jgi:hypothetical protein